METTPWGVGASQLMILVVSLTKTLWVIERRSLWMWSRKYIRATILFNVVNRCNYRPKLVVFCTIAVETQVEITWIWNQVRNFRTGSGYPVPTTNHYDWCVCVWSVWTPTEIEDVIGHRDTKIISDVNLPYLVRQMAVHADVSIVFLIIYCTTAELFGTKNN